MGCEFTAENADSLCISRMIPRNLSKLDEYSGALSTRDDHSLRKSSIRKLSRRHSHSSNSSGAAGFPFSMDPALISPRVAASSFINITAACHDDAAADAGSREEKRVKFADELGGALLHIKHTHTHHLLSAQPPHHGVNLFSANFSQSSSSFSSSSFSAAFTAKLRAQKVCLWRASLVDSDIVLGEIAVVNLCYHKRVWLRLSANRWATWSEMEAHYICPLRSSSSSGSSGSSSPPFSTSRHQTEDKLEERRRRRSRDETGEAGEEEEEEFDLFSFSLTLPRHYSVGSRLEFAIRFDAYPHCPVWSAPDSQLHAAAHSYWDNNAGENYAFECFARMTGVVCGHNWSRFV